MLLDTSTKLNPGSFSHNAPESFRPHPHAPGLAVPVNSDWACQCSTRMCLHACRPCRRPLGDGTKAFALRNGAILQLFPPCQCCLSLGCGEVPLLLDSLHLPLELLGGLPPPRTRSIVRWRARPQQHPSRRVRSQVRRRARQPAGHFDKSGPGAFAAHVLTSRPSFWDQEACRCTGRPAGLLGPPAVPEPLIPVTPAGIRTIIHAPRCALRALVHACFTSHNMHADRGGTWGNHTDARLSAPCDSMHADPARRWSMHVERGRPRPRLSAGTRGATVDQTTTQIVDVHAH